MVRVSGLIRLRTVKWRITVNKKATFRFA